MVIVMEISLDQWKGNMMECELELKMGFETEFLLEIKLGVCLVFL